MIHMRRRIGIIRQVALLFLIGIIAVGILTYVAQRYFANRTVTQQMELLAEDVSNEVIMSVKEYPAYHWLLRYWYTHEDELDIEYDADFRKGTQTEAKSLLLSERHPDVNLKYAASNEIISWPAEDQKLYAEVAYSWLITRINQIKVSYDVDYLFCVVTDDTFLTQDFLFSAADPGAVRGTHYEEVYPLGMKVSVAENEAQQNAMRTAKDYQSHFAAAGNYVDYYAYLCDITDKTVLIGLTYDLSSIRGAVFSQAGRETSLAIIYQICLSLVCLGLISVFVLRPLKTVQTNIRLYKETKDSETVIRDLAKVPQVNEIGDLANDVSELAKEIDHYLKRIETITTEKGRIETELSLAARIQENMLPNVFPAFPHRSEFEIYASMTPAKEVGGDFYDFFMIDDDHLAIVIADVSGKGVPAALFMMVSMILIHTTVMQEPDPARALQIVNEEICANNREEMFVSVWLGILQLSTGTITAANAGHEYPILKNGDGHFEIIKNAHGFVIGGMAGLPYKSYTMQLQPGARLFLYTDGVPEATNTRLERFGLDRTLDALREAEDDTPEKILAKVNRRVNAFVGEAQQFDDLTMLCLHYVG